MSLPKISVVMPVYNTKEQYLREAIESILNQTFKNFEFIIIDDGSTDKNIKKIISSYNDKRIRYLYKENSGIADSLNYGIKKSNGEYIARMDSDDISLPNRFEKEVLYLDSHKDISLVSALYERFPEYYIPKHPERVGILDLLVQGCVIAHPLVMFRKGDFEAKNLFYDKNLLYSQDYDLWSRAIMAGCKLSNIPEVLLRYRSHPDNISNTKRAQQEKIAQDVRERIVNFMTSDSSLQNKLKSWLESLYFNSISTLYLFHHIPLLKFKRKKGAITVKLFNAIPLLKIKEK